MTIATYTSPDQVRSALGLSKTEIPDSVLIQEQWATMLELDFAAVSTDLQASYTTIAAIDENTRTAAEKKVYQLTRLFATLSVAKSLLPSANMFSVKSLSDGKAEFERQDDVHLKMAEGLLNQYSAIRLALAAAYLAYLPGASVITSPATILTLAVGLASDPVTSTDA